MTSPPRDLQTGATQNSARNELPGSNRRRRIFGGKLLPRVIGCGAAVVCVGALALSGTAELQDSKVRKVCHPENSSNCEYALCEKGSSIKGDVPEQNCTIISAEEAAKESQSRDGVLIVTGLVVLAIAGVELHYHRVCSRIQRESIERMQKKKEA